MKKLQLNKEVVAQLNNDSMAQIKGGNKVPINLTDICPSFKCVSALCRTCDCKIKRTNFCKTKEQE